MSSLLEEAFVEANTLKEAAKQQAQADLVQKYSKELDLKISKILAEQNLEAVFEAEEDEDPLALGGEEGGEDLGGDLGMDMGGFEDDLEDPMADGEGAEDPVDSQIPYAFSDGERMCPCEEEDEEVDIELDLGDLMADEDETREEFIDKVGNEDDMGDLDAEMGLEDEEKPLEEDLLSSLFEQDYLQELAEELDMGESKPTPALRTSRIMHDNNPSLDEFLDSLAPEEESKDKKEDEEDLLLGDKNPYKQVNKDLEESNKKLKKSLSLLKKKSEKLEQYNEAFSEKLQEAADALRQLSLENDKLRYQNSVLENVSLNERQKSKLVEAISHAKSEQEAASIYNLRESFVASASTNRQSNRNPLDEMLSKRPSPAMNLRRTQSLNESKDNDNELERQKQVWKKLAGI